MIALAPCPAPVLTTTRLRLRPMVPRDWPAYAAFMASDRACHMGGPYDTRAAWGLFCHDAAGWALWGLGALMIDRGADGVAVGHVGLQKATSAAALRLGAVSDPAAPRQPGDDQELVFRHAPGARA